MGATDPVEIIGPLMRMTYREMVAQVEAQFACGDISLAQWIALKLIRDGKVTCIGVVASELGYTSGATTRLIDQLENRGYLKRLRDTRDRRVISLNITGVGQSVAHEMEGVIHAFWRQMLSAFSDEEASLLIELMTRLRSTLAKNGTDASSRKTSDLLRSSTLM